MRELETHFGIASVLLILYSQYLASTKSPLHTAVKEQNVQEVIRLIEEGIIDVNKQDSHGWAPLHVCVTSNLTSSSIKVRWLMVCVCARATCKTHVVFFVRADHQAVAQGQL